MHETSQPPIQNWLLAALPSEDYERLAPHMEHVTLSHSQIINQSNGSIPYVYFPEHSMVSIVSNMADGAIIEVGIVGREGMAGISVLMGVETTHHENMVQIPDGGMRIKSEVLKAEFNRGGALHDLLMRYIHGLMIQISQLAVCNRLHTVDERLARWLLMCSDRTGSDELPLTHEFLGMMLGSRRAGVTTAAISLQAKGFIRYLRGRVTILDRKGLEDFTCECYAIIKAEFERARV